MSNIYVNLRYWHKLTHPYCCPSNLFIATIADCSRLAPLVAASCLAKPSCYLACAPVLVVLSCVAACVCIYALYWSIQLQSCKCVSINLLYCTLHTSLWTVYHWSYFASSTQAEVQCRSVVNYRTVQSTDRLWLRLCLFCVAGVNFFKYTRMCLIQAKIKIFWDRPSIS